MKIYNTNSFIICLEYFNLKKCLEHFFQNVYNTVSFFGICNSNRWAIELHWVAFCGKLSSKLKFPNNLQVCVNNASFLQVAVWKEKTKFILFYSFLATFLCDSNMTLKYKHQSNKKQRHLIKNSIRMLLQEAEVSQVWHGRKNHLCILFWCARMWGLSISLFQLFAGMLRLVKAFNAPVGRFVLFIAFDDLFQTGLVCEASNYYDPNQSLKSSFKFVF